MKNDKNDYSPARGKHSRRGIYAATDHEDFSANKRFHVRPPSYWLHRLNWLPVVDLETLWIRSIYCDRSRHFVRWPLCKCQQCTSTDAKIGARNQHCTSREFHSRFQSIAAGKRNREVKAEWAVPRIASESVDAGACSRWVNSVPGRKVSDKETKGRQPQVGLYSNCHYFTTTNDGVLLWCQGLFVRGTRFD